MLPRGRRLTRSDFSAIGTGKRAVSAHFSISWRPSTEGKAAAVVSKKVAKRSVDRHLVKRRILAVVEPLVQNGRSFVVYARSGSEALPYSHMKRELETLLTSLPKV